VLTMSGWERSRTLILDAKGIRDFGLGLILRKKYAWGEKNKAEQKATGTSRPTMRSMS